VGFERIWDSCCGIVSLQLEHHGTVACVIAYVICVYVSRVIRGTVKEALSDARLEETDWQIGHIIVSVVVRARASRVISGLHWACRRDV
jgi:hypothetical protein